MKKIRLKVEALRVSSFEPAGGSEARSGTVAAHSFTEPPLECWPGETNDRDTCLSCIRYCATPTLYLC